MKLIKNPSKDQLLESDAVGYDVGKYIYHITPKTNLPSIKRNGLLPKDGTSINWDLYKNRLYFTTSLIAAYDLAINFEAHNKGKKYLILKIDSNCLINGYKEDKLFSHGIYTEYPISYEYIIDIIVADDLVGKYSDEDLENLY